MAIAFVKDFSDSQDFLSTTTVTVPAGGVAAGNTLIIVYYIPSSTGGVTSVSDTRGNTYTIHGTESLGSLVAVLISASISTALISGDTITLSNPSGESGLAICSEFSGLASSSIDQYTSGDIAFDTALSCGPTGTTVQADELVFSAFFAGSNSVTFTPGSGFTQTDTGGYPGAPSYTYLNQYKVVSATGTQTATATASAATAAIGLLATFKAEAGTPAQHLAPSADSVDNAYTDQGGGTSLAAAIDETTFSDTDYIQSANSPSNAGCRVKLASGSDPSLSTGHVIHWRIRKSSADQTVNMTVKLYQGGGNVLGAGTLIATRDRNNITTSFATFDETLTGTEADAITNYADLYLEFYATAS
jgi:hypothetical protein